MRFLFVYETAAGRVRDLLAELLVTDVHVIVARKGEFGPRPDEAQLLKEHMEAEAAACELNRKYRKSVLQYVKFTVEPKKFRVEDQQLRSWLLGDDKPEGQQPAPAPKSAFEQAAASASRLVLLRSALASANDLDGTRWAFAATSADLLRRQAAGADLGPFREWDVRHGVAFAANGQVAYRYKIEVGGKRWEGSSEWHLKAGDRTTAARAARVYFTTADVAGAALVLVAYVGPHPADGTYTADFGSIELEK